MEKKNANKVELNIKAFKELYRAFKFYEWFL